MTEERHRAEQAREEIETTLQKYRSVMGDRAGVPLEQWSRPNEVQVDEKNVAGVAVPVLRQVVFSEVRYSLFGTPPWVDRTLADLRERNRRQAVVDILQRQEQLLRSELTRIIQRVNLFEKIMIPEARGDSSDSHQIGRRNDRRRGTLEDRQEEAGGDDGYRAQLCRLRT